MNEKLRTSGGNIIAIVVLLFVGYTTFLQLTNRVGNNFGSSFLLAILIVACTTLLFGGLQLLKTTTNNFKKKIKIERILLLGSPIIFYIMMQPFIQFWNVQKNADVITQTYEKATGYTKRIFDEYDKYANQRITQYDAMLQRIIRNKNVRPIDYHSCGFTGRNDKVIKENKVKMLRTQLVSNNFKNLRDSAMKWSDSKHKASVWNFFMQTNLSELNEAITTWHKELVGLSEKKLSDEEFKQYNKVETFDAHDNLLHEIQKDLSSISTSYLRQDEQSAKGYLFMIIAYLLLLIPYLVQPRDPKSIYHLFYKESINGGINLNGTIHVDKPSEKQIEQEMSTINIDDKGCTSNEKDNKRKNDDISISMDYDMKYKGSRRKKRANQSTNIKDDNEQSESSFTI